jgi:cytochrome c5
LLPQCPLGAGVQNGIDYKNLESVSRQMTFEGERNRTMQASSGFRKLGLFTKLMLALSVTVIVTIAASGSSLMGKTLVENNGTFSTAAFPESGSALYTAKCAKCHGADGRGDTAIGRSLDAPDFTDEAWRARRSTGEMISVVTKGQKGMPAFSKKLTRRQISSLVSFVQSFK